MHAFPPYFAGLILLILSSFAVADDLVISREILKDSSANLSIQDVEKSHFQAAGNFLTGGYTKAAYWIRLQVKSPEQGAEVILRILPTYLDEVKLYAPDPATPGLWSTALTGDHYSYRDRGSIPLGFSVHPLKPVTTYYLRLSTTSSSTLNVEALIPPEAKLKDLKQDIFQIVYLGIMLCIFFWAIFDFFLNRQSITINFLIFQAVYMLYDIAIMGYLSPFMPADSALWADQLTNIFVVSIAFFALLFQRKLFQLFNPPAILLNGMLALSLIYPFELFEIFIGHTQIAVQTNAVLVLLLGPLCFLIAMTTRQDAPPGRHLLRIAFTLQLIATLIHMLTLLGIIHSATWILYSAPIHGLISSVLMFWILFSRSWLLQRNSQHTIIELELTNQKLNIEKVRNEEQNRFMSMLTHELKTPMTVIQLALGRLNKEGLIKTNAEAAMYDMSAIIDRCQQVDLFEQNQLTPRFTPCRIDEMLLDLQTKNASAKILTLNFESLHEIKSDRQLLQIILENLVNNAIKYTATESAITITARTVIINEKTGISVHVQNVPGTAGYPDTTQLFKKYYRSPGAHKKSGTGLGLYLARSLTCALNGTLNYDLIEGKVTFTLWLPD
jgi:signal transduction histidine kinase